MMKMRRMVSKPVFFLTITSLCFEEHSNTHLYLMVSVELVQSGVAK